MRTKKEVNMSFLQFSTSPNRGVISYNVIRPNKNQSMGVHLLLKFNEDEFLNTAALSTALEGFIKNAPTLLKPFSEEGWKDKAVAKLSNIANEVRSLQQSAISRAVDLEKRYKEWLEPKSISDNYMAEIRSYIRTLKPADVMRKAISDGVIANAIVQNPHGIQGVNDNSFFTHVEHAAIQYNFAQMYGKQMTLKPSLDCLVAHGLDEKAIAEYVTKALDNWKSSKADVQTIEKILRQAICFYAVAADVSLDQAFDIIGLGE